MNSMNLSHLLPYQTRSICPENRTGGKGMGDAHTACGRHG